MISDKFIKQGFLVKVLNEEAASVKWLQLKAMYAWGIGVRSGAMRGLLRLKSTAKASTDGASITLKYAPENRYLDIPLSRLKSKSKRKYASRLYNRVVYGRIYGNLLPRIKYGFSDTVKEQLAQELGDQHDIDINI